ncbi:phosphomethylpyrimidine synthase ThiC [Methanohalophilus portucalensis]|uniref:Phosphomethylpyrimidine synthase n=2 Tax=Methanohalophilus portucalensis TaxID=39664 RepID=A0A1L9C2E4_9EURY|nr:phosphomethylpyrimidine synthase ThiC [Methanohalophilus portucalensis]ATU07332.1 phosphomethylpyrimidine synthase [Methanohalophilus portucalensis]OJH48626.1 thiamine biosynthesis protein ThiC [Methanohalophilus portucalensis FDF-1]RNI09521.1 phosphomethylpyrimidine synthase ThiC [Methanohalophilus portucalensis FDF-1]SMH40071.1 phosphomethylpyrimidine synthase [Methanohalophilus portucalensis FDF-1]
MLTQIDHAKNGELTAEMQQVAVQENMDPDTVLSHIARGSLVIMTRQDNPPVAIGEGATTKINVNLGSSAASIDTSSEIEKARIAEKYGADTITDLSMGGDIQQIRKAIIENTTLPLTTVPVYQAVVECGLKKVTSSDILSYLRSQIAEGISSVVLHCVEKQMLEEVKGSGRLMGMVSKGGSFTSVFMLGSDCENPFLENFDEVMEILRDKDVVLSLGNTMRSGCIHDRPDKAQLMEMENNAALAKRANEQGIQVIIEGMGGHVAAASIPEYVGTYRSKSCHPLFVAGPLPTDIALGYDHVAGAIGASMASGAGADYLCYITPSEHLSLPTPDQVREGLVAFKIAAHVGDSIKYGMAEKDRLLAKRRASFDWEGQMELAFDQDRPRDFCPMEGPCSMCGEYCAIQIMGEYLAEGE